jgi:copper homeostasis protein
MVEKLVFEVCLDSIESGVAAQEGGANRVELCSALLDGGLTPSYGTLRVARRRLAIKIMAMVRPRGGDFCYSDAELEVMKHDLEMIKNEGADGAVLGLLNPDGTVDAARTAELVALARPLPVTFHRAFDMTRDPFEALETLIALGVDRVLTSGQEPTVLEGVPLLRELIERAGDRIMVMPGGPVSERNIAQIAAATGARELHFACFEEQESVMRYRNPRVYMGGTLRPPEYSLGVVRSAAVRSFIGAASSRP